MNQLKNSFNEEQLAQDFDSFAKHLISLLSPKEHVRLSLSSEQTQFTRFSRGKVRQNGSIDDASVRVQFISSEQSTAEVVVPFVPLENETLDFARRLLDHARTQAIGAPRDPYVTLPSEKNSSHVRHTGTILGEAEIVAALLGPTHPDDDLVGIYAGGKSISALADSAGSHHWFSSESFFVDYSLWLSNGRAVKSGYAGRDWKQSEFTQSLQSARSNLITLKKPAKVIKPGTYRVFLAPSATSELLGMFSWGALSEGALQRKESPLVAVRRGEKSFSPLFSLRENYQLGFAPRFSGQGELSPEIVPIFDNGNFVQALCSARTAKEYGVKSNGSGYESLRTPDMGTGTLPIADCFKELGTGLYLSDLHYLNWSDRNQGRVTGMTRYGCMWIENGVPVGPIQDMRFDETIFRCFGSELLNVSRESVIIPDTSTYERRALGGARVPGILLREFNFTL